MTAEELIEELKAAIEKWGPNLPVSLLAGERVEGMYYLTERPLIGIRRRKEDAPRAILLVEK